MTAIRFLSAKGDETLVEATPGARLLDVAQAAGQPLEGTCGGQVACSTCHVWIDEAEALPCPREEEDDLLDMTPFVRRTSRLACQIVVGDDPLTVRMPHAGR